MHMPYVWPWTPPASEWLCLRSPTSALAGFCWWLLSAKGQGIDLTLFQLSYEQTFLCLLKLMSLAMHLLQMKGGFSKRSSSPSLFFFLGRNTGLWTVLYCIHYTILMPGAQIRESGQLWAAEPPTKGLAGFLHATELMGVRTPQVINRQR